MGAAGILVRMLKVYSRVFVVSAILFGVVFGLPIGLLIGDLRTGLVVAAIIGLFAGLSMAAGAGTVHIRSVRRAGGDGPDAFAVRQRRRLRLDVPPAQAFDRATRAVAALPNTRVAGDPTTGRIEANVPMTSWRSVGERVTVVVEPAGSNGSLLSLESRPTVPLTQVDYGKNRDNVERICAALGAGRAV